MFEIRNKTAGPIQLIIRSRDSYSPMVPRKHSAAFTCLNIYGFKTILLEDEQVIDKYLKHNEKLGYLSHKVIQDKK